MNRFFATIACAVLALLSGCIVIGGFSSSSSFWSSGPDEWIEEELQLEATPAAGLRQIDCRSKNGSITLRAQPGAQAVTVDLKIKAGGADIEDAQLCRDAIEIIHRVEGDRLVLGWRWLEERLDGWGASVSFMIHAPDSLYLNLNSHNGKIMAEGARAGGSIETHNGRIAAQGIAGAWKLHTHNGGIELAGDCSESDVESHNGRIEATLSANGRIDHRFVTHNGGVKVELDGNPSAQVQCETNNGSISFGSRIHEIQRERRWARGRVGEGQGSIDIETHNGSIKVR